MGGSVWGGGCWPGCAALTLALAFVVVTGPAGPPRVPEPRQPRPGSLMLMSGVDSSSGDGAILEIDPHGLGYTCDQTYYFSYAGPGGGQPRGAALCPVRTGAPYSKNDTMRPNADLVAALEAQLADLPPPVVLITHSQGVWITWEAALRHRPCPPWRHAVGHTFRPFTVPAAHSVPRPPATR